MRHIRKLSGIAVLAGASAAAIAASAFAAEYSMTVNRDRLINAQNEPQNWLMMNGDYGSMRYSKLTQFNRDNVKNLRMVWALALGGMQDVGQNGPENEVNPLIDNGFMYTTDGWGTVYKIDARNPNKGEFVWISDSGVRHEGNVPRTRGIALWDDLVIANLPDGRVDGVEVDVDDQSQVPFDDPATFELLQKGDTVGVFQLEGQGMRDALRKLKPDRFEDIIAIVALYRPGPMDNIDSYMNRKHGREGIESLHDTIAPILSETYGVIIYQEQVMQIAQVLSGFSLGEADLLRRAMGKKIKKEMAAQKTRFVEGAVGNGVERGRAEPLLLRVVVRCSRLST